MCESPSDLNGRLTTLRQTKGTEAYEALVSRLPSSERFVVRLLFELEVGWLEAVHLIAMASLDEDRMPNDGELERSQDAIVESLQHIRSVLDRELPLDAAK